MTQMRMKKCFCRSTVKNPNLAHPLVGSPHGGGFRSEALTLQDDVQSGLACALAVQTRISRKKPPLRREQSHFTSTFCGNGMCWRGVSCCFLAIVTGLRCVICGDSGSSRLIGLRFAATGYVAGGRKIGQRDCLVVFEDVVGGHGYPAFCSVLSLLLYPRPGVVVFE